MTQASFPIVPESPQSPPKKRGRPRKENPSPKTKQYRAAYHNKSNAAVRVPPGYLTRAMVLERTGLTDGQLMSLLRQRRLKRSRTTSYNTALYSEGEVERMMRELGRQVENGLRMPNSVIFTTDVGQGHVNYRAEDAKKVILLMKAGRKLDDIFLGTDVHPRAIKAIVVDYKDLAGAVVLSREMMVLVNKLPLQGAMPITEPEDLYESIKLALDAGVCRSCRSLPAETCRGCARREHRPRPAQASAGTPPSAGPATRSGPPTGSASPSEPSAGPTPSGAPTGSSIET